MPLSLSATCAEYIALFVTGHPHLTCLNDGSSCMFDALVARTISRQIEQGRNRLLGQRSVRATQQGAPAIDIRILVGATSAISVSSTGAGIASRITSSTSSRRVR